MKLEDLWHAWKFHKVTTNSLQRLDKPIVLPHFYFLTPRVIMFLSLIISKNLGTNKEFPIHPLLAASLSGALKLLSHLDTYTTIKRYTTAVLASKVSSLAPSPYRIKGSGTISP